MKPTMIMMIGLPGSGKSVKAQELAKEYDAEIFSSDKLREELYGEESMQGDNAKLFKELHNRIKHCLRNGKNTIYDATNVSYKRRMGFLSELNRIRCNKVCVFMATPYEECLRRNAERDRKVPEYVIERMYRQITIPYWYEGWDDIQIEYGNYACCYGHPSHFAQTYMDYNQNNSHHALTLGEHCKNTCLSLVGRGSELEFAGLLHDCGKPFCATNVNKKGETTTDTHYYDHQYIGAYNSLFYDYEDMCDTLDVAILITWHMQPYFNKEEKTKEKYKKFWGDRLHKNLMLLHKADKEAH